MIEIEKAAERITRRLLSAGHVELRATSGQTASLDVIVANTGPGGVVMNVAYENGGHGWERFALDDPAINYSPQYFAFDMDEWNIDIDESAKLIRKYKPDLLMLGSSYPLFPQPIKELRQLADEVGAVVAADEAHTFGIILGGEWPNPLSQGAHLILASTNKSFPGPPHGIIATNDLKQYRSLQKTIVPALVSDHQVGNTAALAVALAEFSVYGQAYAKQVVKNARALASTLASEGLPVVGEKHGYTQSQHVLAVTDAHMHSWNAMKALDKASIIVNPMDLKGVNGLRLGTSELTRRGMGEGEMSEVARLIREVIIDKKDPAAVDSRVREFTSGFRSIRYSFDEGKPPYKSLAIYEDKKREAIAKPGK